MSFASVCGVLISPGSSADLRAANAAVIIALLDLRVNAAGVSGFTSFSRVRFCAGAVLADGKVERRVRFWKATAFFDERSTSWENFNIVSGKLET